MSSIGEYRISSVLIGGAPLDTLFAFSFFTVLDFIIFASHNFELWELGYPAFS
jgi:hypothetical protein